MNTSKDKDLEIHNHGPLIAKTNFWETEWEAAGRLLVSPLAGAFRVLWPRSQQGFLEEAIRAKGCAVSRGPWPEAGRDDAFEVLFDDGTSDPFRAGLPLEAFVLLPAPRDLDHEWSLSVWTAPRRGKPHLAFQRPCVYRLAAKLPDLRPWDATSPKRGRR